MQNLQNPHTVAYYAAVLEAEQAERDDHDAYTVFVATGARVCSPQDYALWSSVGYSSTAAQVVRNMPVWEA